MHDGIEIRPLFNQEQDGFLAALLSALEDPEVDRACLATAFLTMQGYRELRSALRKVAKHAVVQILVGTMGYITDPAAVHALQSLAGGQIKVRMYDSQHFHAKLYLFGKKNGTHRIIIGSHNLTPSGLSTNIEAAISLEIDVTSPHWLDLYQFEKRYGTWWQDAQSPEKVLSYYEEEYRRHSKEREDQQETLPRGRPAQSDHRLKDTVFMVCVGDWLSQDDIRELESQGLIEPKDDATAWLAMPYDTDTRYSSDLCPGYRIVLYHTSDHPSRYRRRKCEVGHYILRMHAGEKALYIELAQDQALRRRPMVEITELGALVDSAMLVDQGGRLRLDDCGYICIAAEKDFAAKFEFLRRIAGKQGSSKTASKR